MIDSKWIPFGWRKTPDSDESHKAHFFFSKGKSKESACPYGYSFYGDYRLKPDDGSRCNHCLNALRRIRKNCLKTVSVIDEILKESKKNVKVVAKD